MLSSFATNNNYNWWISALLKASSRLFINFYVSRTQESKLVGEWGLRTSRIELRIEYTILLKLNDPAE